MLEIEYMCIKCIQCSEQIQNRLKATRILIKLYQSCFVYIGILGQRAYWFKYLLIPSDINLLRAFNLYIPASRAILPVQQVHSQYFTIKLHK